MRIRDLTQQEINKLKTRAVQEFDSWKISATDVDIKATWLAAYGKGLNAGLEQVPHIDSDAAKRQGT